MNASLAHPLRNVAFALLAVMASPALFAAPSATPEPQSASALPVDSVYQLSVALTDQLGRTSQLADRRGQPALVSMFYTSCQAVCPMLVDALRDTEAKLSPQERTRLSILMVSFDPEHDTVNVLKRTADERGLDSAHWTLARTDAKSVRKFAAVLGIQYRALKNGDFNHTSVLILLDADGRVSGRTTQLGNADPAFVKVVKAAVQRPSL
jgi:protein SCO1/2